MPSMFIISGGQMAVLDKNGQPTTLGSTQQGSGAHLGSITISAGASFQEVRIDDQGGRPDYLEDSVANQTLDRNIRIDGTRYRRGTEVENEYQITLQDSSGNTYKAWALEIDNGSPPSYDNVVGLSFEGGKVPPFGEELQVIANLDLFNLPPDNDEEFNYDRGVTCFTAGMLVDTPQGPVAVEDIRPGMKVWTLDNGPQEVIWTGRRDLGLSDLQRAPHLKPVIIQPGALGNRRPLAVSRQHRLALPAVGMEAACEMRHFARATLLADQPGRRLRHAFGCRAVSYVHFMCENHQIVRTEGLLSETFYPGAQALKTLGEASRSELFALFPALRLRADPQSAYGALAREDLRRRDFLRAVA